MAANKITANDLTYGIEIELTLPYGCGVDVGAYHVGTQVAGLPDGWKAMRDSSISAGPNHYGAEIVSPVLKGNDGIRQIKTVLAWLREKGARINNSTGFHVHVGWTDTGKGLDRLVALVARHEKGFFAATGTKRRENANWCRPIANDVNFTDRFKDKRRGATILSNRYFSLNLRNFAYGNKPTVEFRLFAGTLNTTKVLGYVSLCLGIVEKALGAAKPITWERAGEYRHAKGEGANELCFLMKQLGWRDRVNVKAGIIAGEDMIDVKQIISEFHRLAKKYDGE